MNTLTRFHLVIILITLSLQTACLTQITHPTPENTIIAFDIDDVILKRHIGKVIKYAFKSKGKLSALFNKKLKRDIKKLYKQGGDTQDFVELFKNHGYESLAYMVEKIAYAKKPIKETVAIIQELKDKGYTLTIASNMSESNFNYFIRKYPDLFGVFESVKIITREHRRRKKPNIEYFEDYQQTCNHNNKQVIFIDDRKENICAARKLGIIGLHFTRARKLRAQLKKLKVL